MELKLQIKGIPVAKQSYRRTKTGINYQAKKITDEESNIRAQVISQLPAGFKPFTELVSLEVLFKFPPLASWSKKKMADFRSGIGIWKITKPDLDNLMKLLKDAIEGVVYVNDAQVCDSHERKVYGDVPGITITIKGEYE